MKHTRSATPLWVVLLSALFLLSASSCLPPIETELTGECSDLSKGEEDYFQDSILNPVLDEHCVVCHSVDLPNGTGLGTRRGAPRFANYNTFSSDTGATRRPNVTWARIADRTMPPMGRQLRPDETDLLYEWLNCVQAVQSQAQGDDDDSAR